MAYLNFNQNPNQSPIQGGSNMFTNPNQSPAPAQWGLQYNVVQPDAMQPQGFMGRAGDAIGNAWGDARGSFLNQNAMFGGTDANGMQQGGWFSPTTQALGALTQGYLGFQNLGLAKDQLAFQKDAFAKNWANQTQLTNQALYDQYAARQAGYGNKNVQGKDEYLAQHGVQ